MSERNPNGRGGRDRKPRNNKGRDFKGDSRKKKSFSPQRSGYREERINRRMSDPDIPAEVDVNDLDPMVLQDLKSLSKENSEAVAKHMIMGAT